MNLRELCVVMVEKFQFVDDCEDILFDEYIANYIRELEDRLAALELCVEQIKNFVLRNPVIFSEVFSEKSSSSLSRKK
jgi:hypothetical protein